MSRNIAKCKLCNDIIESTFRHHFIRCRCGEIFIDGGSEYHRRGANDLASIGEPSEEELAAYDVIPTGRLENWVVGNGRLWGEVYDDKWKRYADGTNIRTSPIQDPSALTQEGEIITTNGAKYLLGKPYVEEPVKVFRVHNEFDNEKQVCELCLGDLNEGITDDRERFHSPVEVAGSCEYCERSNHGNG